LVLQIRACNGFDVMEGEREAYGLPSLFAGGSMSKVKLIVEMTDEAAQRLEALVERRGTNVSETIRVALHLLTTAQIHADAGGTILMVSKDGEQSELLVANDPDAGRTKSTKPTVF
jgi:Mg-chelatase subunit ChlD